MDFRQKVALKTVDFLVDFSVDFFLLVFPRKMARKNPRKNPPPKPNTKIHQTIQGRGVLMVCDMFLSGPVPLPVSSLRKCAWRKRLQFLGERLRGVHPALVLSAELRDNMYPWTAARLTIVNAPWNPHKILLPEQKKVLALPWQ